MNKFLHSRALVYAAFLSLSTYSLQAQGVTNEKNKTDEVTANEVAATPVNAPATVGKEIPVPGGVLFVTAAERAGMQKEMAAKEEISNKEKRRLRRLKRLDRKDVTDVIGHSVDNYLDNATTVHTLQRFSSL